MRNYEDIKKFVTEYKGMITINDFKKEDISHHYINQLIEDKIIERVGTGVYNKCEEFKDEFFVMQQNSKRIIFSFNTALYFINKTEVTPYRIDVTVPNGYNVHRINKDVVIHYIPEENLYLGATKVQTPYGNEVLSYNLERCICDIIRCDNTGLDIEQINKVIRNAFLKKQIDFNILTEYAKKLKCDKKLNQYTEVLL